MLGFHSMRAVVRPAALAIALVVCTGAAWADNGKEPGRRGSWPQASLQAQAVTEVAHDRVRITLAHEVSGRDQTVVAQELGKAVESALVKARSNEKVKARSGAYNVWPMNDEQGRISNWRGRAEIILDASDFAAASELAGQLGETMAVAGMNFYLSAQARSKYEAELLDDASKAFRDRAAALARSFGFDDYAIREISLGGAGANYESAPAARMMAMAADKSVAVPLEPGTERVSVSITGSIFLRSAKK